MTRLLSAIFGTFILIGTATTAIADETLASGTFTGASDHVTTGLIEIVKDGDGYIARLADDFSLDGAPDPKLGFGNDGAYDDSTTFSVLENLTGEQVYAIPASIDPSAYNEFYIWCEKFAVPLGVASLN